MSNTSNNNSNGSQNSNGKKNFLFISIEGLISDIAWQVAKEGHNVKFFIENNADKQIGDGFVEKTDDYEKEVDWADVIVFDDVLGQGALAKKLRDKGKLVVGGSPYTDRLEDDRAYGQEELKKAGISIIPYQEFSSFDEAIKFVKANPAKYVIKPSGQAQNIKRLLFVGEEDDGMDVIQILEAYKKSFNEEIKVFQLQRRVTGVEVAVGAFFNGKEFMYPINVNFEHKKLFPGNIGPSTGEMGCYDEKTEVLTEKGWKNFKDVIPGDKICTLNPESNHIEYNTPEMIVEFNHHNKLLSIQNQTLDIQVTLDHNMYVNSQQDARNGRENFKFVKARDLETQSVIKRTGNWKGITVKHFVLPSVEFNVHRGNQMLMHKTPEINISMDSWLAFMGIWIAEGSFSGNTVHIAQKKQEATAKILDVLEKMPFNIKKDKTGFRIHNKQLTHYLSKFGKAPEKYVPEFVKRLSKKQIEKFLEWYCLGDGTIMKSGHRIFYTSSKQLADDVQELLLKIGRVGVVKKRTGQGIVWIKDHYADASRVQYEVHERIKKSDSWIDKRDMKIIDYTGKVYCATVKNHVMYVRREGKPYWCGNTLMFWSVPNKLFNMTLKKMETKLAEEQYVGYIDLNCIVNGNGIYPLEFTCFDKETEIMTQDGWKNYKDVKVGDNAFSINPETREMHWKPIVNKTIFRHNGKMIKIGSKSRAHSACDILVTPEHKLLVEKNGKTYFQKAGELKTGEKIVRTGNWNCEQLETVVIPKYAEKHFLGRHKKTIILQKPEIKIHPEYFLKFLGLFLAEGSFGSHGKLIGIPQSLKSSKRKDIEEILDNMGLKYSIQKNGCYQINSVQFCDFLKKLGLDKLKASTKFIPKYFKELKPEMLKHIIEGFVLGDGNIHKRTGQISMATTSKQLADDLQEIILKCGWVANIRTVKAKGTKGIGGYLRKHDIYFLALRKTNTDYYLDQRVIGTQDYDDDVWDVEVKDWHTLLVRRNGKTFFSGNCRFGYPAIFIQQEGIITPMSEFLYQMSKGETNKFKARKGFQMGVRLLLPPYPFDDEKTFDVYSKNAVIIFKKPNYEGVHIEDVRQEKNQWFVTGTSGVVLVVVGTGATVKQAQAQAYHRIDNILIPNMYYRTDIGDRWFEDSDRLHNWGYLRED